MWSDMEGEDGWLLGVDGSASGLCGRLVVMHRKCKSWEKVPWEGSQTVLRCHQAGEGAYAGSQSITSQTA